MRLAWREPVFRIAVICRRSTASVEMNHCARFRKFAARPVKVVVDGQEVFERQLILPFDAYFLTSLGFYQGANCFGSVAPQPGGRKIAVHLDPDFAHGDAV